MQLCTRTDQSLYFFTRVGHEYKCQLRNTIASFVPQFFARPYAQKCSLPLILSTDKKWIAKHYQLSQMLLFFLTKANYHWSFIRWNVKEKSNACFFAVRALAGVPSNAIQFHLQTCFAYLHLYLRSSFVSSIHCCDCTHEEWTLKKNAR